MSDAPVNEIAHANVRKIYEHWEEHDGPSIYSGQTIASIIVDVLDHLNIKVKGVNAE